MDNETRFRNLQQHLLFDDIIINHILTAGRTPEQYYQYCEIIEMAVDELYSRQNTREGVLIRREEDRLVMEFTNEYIHEVKKPWEFFFWAEKPRMNAKYVVVSDTDGSIDVGRYRIHF